MFCTVASLAPLQCCWFYTLGLRSYACIATKLALLIGPRAWRMHVAHTVQRGVPRKLEEKDRGQRRKTKEKLKKKIKEIRVEKRRERKRCRCWFFVDDSPKRERKRGRASSYLLIFSTTERTNENEVVVVDHTPSERTSDDQLWFSSFRLSPLEFPSELFA